VLRQSEIISELGVRPQIDPEKEIVERCIFLESYLGRAGVNGFVLGISGGQDSLLAGILAQRAVSARRSAGFEAEFHAVLLPYGAQADRADALLACEVIGADIVHDLDIKPGTDSFVESYLAAGPEPLGDYHKGNVKARMRMIAQYALAGSHGLVVLGTDHAAEAVTGFFTKFGDGGADVLPLSGLNKRQGRALLQYLDVPEVFTTKRPTADLLDGRPGQADEDELGISYEQLDDYLEGKVVDTNIAEQIERRYDTTRHKRELPLAFEHGSE